MAVQTLSVKPLPGGFGAEVDRFDCNALDDAIRAALRDAWHKYRVMIFRNTVHNDDDLVALGSIFGDLLPSRFTSPLATRSEIMVITNVMVDGKLAGALPDGEMEWHYDGMHQKTPYSGAILFAGAVPSRGGETSFANMCRAYEDLPDAFKTRIEPLTASSSYDYNSASAGSKKISDDAPRAVHPIVRRLPETGEKAIFVAKLMTDRILDVDQSESDEILAQLYEQMSRAEYAYEHKWQLGDAVLWDNRCVVHARNDFDASEQRMLKRVTIK